MSEFEGMAEVHISDIRSFKSCRRKWWYTSGLGMYLEPRVAYVPFILGRAVHFALQWYYDDMKKKGAHEYLLEWFDEEREKMGNLTPKEDQMLKEQLELGYGMCEHYTLWAQRTDHFKRKWIDDTFDFIATEIQFDIPLYRDVQAISNNKPSDKFFLSGRFDGIIRRRDDGKLYLWETKTARNIPDLVKTLWNDEQCGAYVIAAQRLLNVPIEGVMYNVMRKKVPGTPRELQSGLLSRAMKPETSYDWYLSTIVDNDPPPSDMSTEDYMKVVLQSYGDHLQRLKEEHRGYWFDRIVIKRTPEQLIKLESELFQVATEMTDPNTPRYPAPGWNTCNFCKFHEPCKRLNRNESDALMIKAGFKRRGEWVKLSGKET